MNRGFQPLHCPYCGETNATIKLCLNDCDGFTCEECSQDFNIADVQAIVDQWSAVIAWLKTAPVQKEEER